MARLIWTEPALEDLGQIADYIALDDPKAANRLVRRVFSKAALLQDFPEMCPVARELPDSRYRHLVVRPLRIFYRIESGSVLIVYIMRSERLLKVSDLTEHDSYPT
jgi:toxin ParE1/3/4